MNDDELMPRNLVGSGDGHLKAAAQGEGISEEQWRAQNLPAEKITFRWRYADKTVQLYERRLRSLRAYNVGPAVQAWVRSRLEWVVDNKLYERPDGVIVLSVDPDGDVQIELDEQQSCDAAAGTLWEAAGTRLVAHARGGELRDAADTLVRDLAVTLGYDVELADGDEPLHLDEAFTVSDEFGVVAREGSSGPVAAKMAECFEKLWMHE